MDTSDLTSGQLDQLKTFADLVATSPHNLVSKRARSDLWSRHIPEGVALARRVPPTPARLLDVGSGGGFPGLVIAIVRPDLAVHLLDATRKKVEFLESAADALGVGVTVHHGRAEELSGSRDLAGAFDVVTARAVAPLRDLLGLTEPFLAPEGVLYAVKGERWREELEAAETALEAANLTVLATPGDDGGAPRDGEPRVVMIGRAR